MNELFTTVSLREITDSRAFDIHSFDRESTVNESLFESFRRSGLLSPPILVELARGGYEIVCGRRRLRIVRFAGYRSCLCRILSKDTPIEKLLEMVLEDQYSHGPLTLIEQACFLDLCRQSISDEKQRNYFLQRLPKNRLTKGTCFLLPLATLESSIQEAIHRGIIPEKVIVELLRLSKEDQFSYADLVQSLQISGNTQKKLIHQLSDLIKREKMTLGNFLKREEIQRILGNKEANRRHQQTQFLQLLSSLHQPKLNSASQAFEKNVAALDLPSRCSLSPATSFERDEITLSIRFSSMAEFNTSWPTIRKAVEKRSSIKNRKQS